MDEKLPENKPTYEVDELALFSPRERTALIEIEASGSRPISPTLAMQFFELFLEGYSCNEIAKQNPPFKEGEVLFLRKKFKWDNQRDDYAYQLQTQMREKLIKQKLESLEFLTNMLAVVHKEQRPKTLRYLQTGKDEDRPDTWITGPTAYKNVLETIQKITGEDRVSTQNIKSESKVTVESNQPLTIISPELQSKMLKKLAMSDAKDAKKIDKKDE